MKKILLSTLLLLAACAPAFASDIVGFWKSINEDTNRPESLIAIYPYKGKYYGRLILTYTDEGTIADTIYQPHLRAPGVIGHPYYSGLDLIWDLEKEGNKYTYGIILDPQAGKEYNAEVWRDKENLVVRGSLFMFGRNQTWLPAGERDFPPGFRKPDLTALTPKIPQVATAE